jgi:hypothetical protein
VKPEIRSVVLLLVDGHSFRETHGGDSEGAKKIIADFLAAALTDPDLAEEAGAIRKVLERHAFLHAVTSEQVENCIHDEDPGGEESTGY